MRKLFLLGTMLGVATTALAFGGMFNHGSKSTTYKGGVDAIGVHVNGKGTATIDIRSCDSETEELVGSECCLKTSVYIDNDTTKCCSLEGYAVQDGKCKKQCGEGLVLNEETNDCEDACPAERRCGDYCCGADNICNKETEQCCSEALNYCCPAGQTVTQKMQYGIWSPICCSGDAYCSWMPSGGGSCNYLCCDGTPYLVAKYPSGEGYGCCTGNVLYAAGENGADECLE